MVRAREVDVLMSMHPVEAVLDADVFSGARV